MASSGLTLADLRAAMQPDGVDIEVVSIEDGVARARLVLGPDACLDCIMPTNTLEEMLLDVLSNEHSGVQRVDLHDPRVVGP